MSKHFSDCQLFLALLTTTHFSLGLVLHPVSNSPWQVHQYSASPTSWDLQHNSGFTFKVSCNGLSGLPMQGHIPDTGLTSMVSLSCGGRFYNPFLISLTLKLEPWGQNKADAAMGCCLLGLELGSLFQLHLHQLSVADGSCHCLSFPLFLFTGQSFGGLGLALRLSFLLFHLAPGFLKAF